MIIELVVVAVKYETEFRLQSCRSYSYLQ